MMTIIKNKLERLKKLYPDIELESLRKMALLEVRTNNFGNFSNIRKNSVNLQIDESKLDSILYMYRATQNEEDEKTNKEEMINTNSYRYSYEFLKNLRMKFLNNSEKLSKYQKQLQERNLDLLEFNPKLSKFHRLIATEIKMEMRDFAFDSKSELEFNQPSEHLLSGVDDELTDKASTSIRKRRSTNRSREVEKPQPKEQIQIWDKINKRNKIAKSMMPKLPTGVDQMNIGGQFSDFFDNQATSFTRVFKEFQKFTLRREDKLKNVNWLENQLEVLKEKRVVFEGQAKNCYSSLIKNPNEYEKFGLVRIFDELLYFGFPLETLPFPSICNIETKEFILKFSRWRWEINNIEVPRDAEIVKNQQLTQNINTFAEVLKFFQENVISKFITG